MDSASSSWTDQVCLLAILVTMVVVAHKLFIRRDGEQALKRHNPAQDADALKRVWQAKGAVRIDPVSAYYYGRQAITKENIPGCLGVINSVIVFGTVDEPVALRIPISALRWASCTVLEISALTGEPVLGLALHVEQGSRWEVHVFRVVAPSGMAGQLHAVLGVPVMRDSDLGPMTVAMFEQDIYGHWEKSGRSVAYLAPDRLLLNGKTALRSADLRSIAISSAEGLSMGMAALLRLGYRRANGSLGGLGVQMPRRDVQRWADALSARSGIPVRVHDGRKGKDEKLAS